MSLTTAYPRPIAILAGAAAALLLLGGCSAAPEESAGSGAATDAAGLLPEAEGKTTYPLTLESPFGETELLERPERIAIVTPMTPDTDTLLALGGTPVLAPSTIDRNTWLDESLTAPIPEVWEASAGAEIPVELVAASEPDLIVTLLATPDVDQQRYDQLSAIAPVLYAADGSSGWQDLTRTLGEAIDLGDRAERIVADAEQVIVAAREANPEFAGKTASYVLIYNEEFGANYVSTPGSTMEQLLNELGFVLPKEAAAFAEESTVSNELVGLIDADFLLLSTIDQPDYFLDAPLLQAVPAVAEGRAVIDSPEEGESGNSFAWGLNQMSVLSVPWLIERLTGLAQEALGEG
ncbi:ABC transporter substrate-binding protein [Leucobacter sp. M11]|uniref:ABC transporter substrate-binding protein n=1 Tax=Leucobacter sp. M11 TaxID=2993565 RepID=UPI002D7EFAEC|nr:ABC transporter substrate-binding protein [Leucobacter sp. M11]MEB4615142.1 ABC transporter substrate-binding protein [Leucobacter sp. M11]